MGKEIRARLRELVEAMFDPVPTRIPSDQVPVAAEEHPAGHELRLPTDDEPPVEPEG